jgi:hypothetical protein
MVGMERRILLEMMKTAQRTTGTPLPDGDAGKGEAKTSPETRTTHRWRWGMVLRVAGAVRELTGDEILGFGEDSSAGHGEGLDKWRGRHRTDEGRGLIREG